MNQTHHPIELYIQLLPPHLPTILQFTHSIRCGLETAKRQNPDSVPFYELALAACKARSKELCTNPLNQELSPHTDAPSPSKYGLQFDSQIETWSNKHRLLITRSQ